MSKKELLEEYFHSLAVSSYESLLSSKPDDASTAMIIAVAPSEGFRTGSTLPEWDTNSLYVVSGMKEEGKNTFRVDHARIPMATEAITTDLLSEDQSRMKDTYMLALAEVLEKYALDLRKAVKRNKHSPFLH